MAIAGILGILGAGSAEGALGSQLLGGILGSSGQQQSGGAQQGAEQGASDPVDSVSLSPQAQDHVFSPGAVDSSSQAGG